jgi:hypothetical protein
MILGVWEFQKRDFTIACVRKKGKESSKWFRARQDAWEVFKRRLRCCIFF